MAIIRFTRFFHFGLGFLSFGIERFILFDLPPIQPGNLIAFRLSHPGFFQRLIDIMLGVFIVDDFLKCRLPAILQRQKIFEQHAVPNVLRHVQRLGFFIQRQNFNIETGAFIREHGAQLILLVVILHQLKKKLFLVDGKIFVRLHYLHFLCQLLALARIFFGALQPGFKLGYLILNHFTLEAGQLHAQLFVFDLQKFGFFNIALRFALRCRAQGIRGAQFFQFEPRLRQQRALGAVTAQLAQFFIETLNRLLGGMIGAGRIQQAQNGIGHRTGFPLGQRPQRRLLQTRRRQKNRTRHADLFFHKINFAVPAAAKFDQPVFAGGRLEKLRRQITVAKIAVNEKSGAAIERIFESPAVFAVEARALTVAVARSCCQRLDFDGRGRHHFV
ncbi:MAG: hypothetical protein ALAOOOJD_03121 [bacterium]|nr:hypothetical protein [bacterium]